MPKELRDSEQFQKLLPKAVELRVVRQKEFVKLKLRTPDYLYTYKTNEDEADDILKNAKEIEVVDFGRVKEKEEPEEKADDSKKKKKSN
jgi:Ribosomal L38e protein family